MSLREGKSNGEPWCAKIRVLASRRGKWEDKVGLRRVLEGGSSSTILSVPRCDSPDRGRSSTCSRSTHTGQELAPASTALVDRLLWRHRALPSATLDKMRTKLSRLKFKRDASRPSRAVSHRLADSIPAGFVPEPRSPGPGRCLFKGRGLVVDPSLPGASRSVGPASSFSRVTPRLKSESVGEVRELGLKTGLRPSRGPL